MSKQLGPRGWVASVWGGHALVFVVTTHRGSVAGKLFQRARNGDVDIEFGDIKVRRCPQLDALPDGFWRECWKQPISSIYGEYAFEREDRVWMDGLNLHDPADLVAVAA